ncbi:serine/threonine protein kinase [Fictibacillus fluitans]|uniref:Protein kinase n=1 Tax=Fictibacillus fluitans TaxID=3058422 RepID=A0ABT8I349_9BACL|nr:protein kinase [Fictibacillus sp. NE201]MDN4527461.1 protein kinase [Fictibacillus sp. NE201]
MKKNTQKGQVFKLHPGDVISGKWHRNEYSIIRELGSGATGTVYLASGQAGKVAVKAGHDSMAIISEVNVLKHFSRVQGKILGPSLIDVDDYVVNGGQVPFYVMEYLKGESLFQFMKNHNEEWAGILLVQLLTDLSMLHRAGWVFGDLKPDNLLVVGPPSRIRWIDVGGTTQIGRSIKEYTEFFDRGYWGLGTRKAEPSYDLFSACMIMVNLAVPSRFEKKKEGRQQLKDVVRSSPLLSNYQTILLKGLYGKYQSAEEMRNELVSSLNNKGRGKVSGASQTSVGSRRSTHKKVIKKNKRAFMFETVLLGSFLFIVYLFYLISQTM